MPVVFMLAVIKCPETCAYCSSPLYDSLLSFFLLLVLTIRFPFAIFTLHM